MLDIRKQSKRELTINWLKKHPNLLQCIHCGNDLHLKNASLICQQNHRFDLAKQGYFYLAKQSKPTEIYTQDLFKLRRHIILDTAFFEPLIQKLQAEINKRLSHSSVVLDAGSGEGSYLYRLKQGTSKELSLIGLDLAKDGIQLATSYNGDMLSVVADLAALPLKNKSVDILLSILSPANYTEFKRVLKESGTIIKVIPQTDYLIELRRALVEQNRITSETYDNQEVVAAFSQHFPQYEQAEVKQTLQLSQADMSALLQMTPLTWHLDTNELKSLQKAMPHSITLSLKILIAEQNI